MLFSSVISFPKLSTTQCGTLKLLGVKIFLIYQKSCLLMVSSFPTLLATILSYPIVIQSIKFPELKVTPALTTTTFSEMFFLILFPLSNSVLVSFVCNGLSFLMRFFFEHFLATEIYFLYQMS